jgi:xanthine/uracil/vitamin C permease (AzgA family)
MFIYKALKRDMITATAALAGLASILFGFLTNLPVALGLVSSSHPKALPFLDKLA